jgi:acetolactate synthase small subunit
MRPQAGLLDPDEHVAGMVVLTVYARADLTVCSRILQAVTVRRFAIERLIADLSSFDHSQVRGLDRVRERVMRISLVVSVDGDHDVERLRKFLHRMIDVYRVEQAFRV